MHYLIGDIHHGRVQVSYVPDRARTGPTMGPCPWGQKWAPQKNVVLNQMGHLLPSHLLEEVDPRATPLDLTHASHQSLVLAPLLDLAPSPVVAPQ